MSESTLDQRIARCPEELQQLIAEFREATPRERLEMMLEFSDDLPDLPERLHAQRDAMEQIHECQSPVFLHTEIDGRVDGDPESGGVMFYLDIPREAPTVRGYAGILAEGLNGATPAAVLSTPEDVYTLLGLGEAITPQRLRGLHALMVYMKRQIQRIIVEETA